MVSVQQYRAAIGSFSSRLVSSRWTVCSGERARKRREWRDESDARREAQETIAKECVVMGREIAIFIFTLMILISDSICDIASIILLGSLPQFIITQLGPAPSGGEGEKCPTNCHENAISDHGLEISGMGTIIVNLVQLLLMVAGDVETNPGPDSVTEAMARLISEAPNDTVKEVLGRWGPDVQVAVQLKKHLVPALQETLAWLWNVDVTDKRVSMNKDPLVQTVLVAIEALLPDTCQSCQEEYCVRREEKPALRCKLCHQGFHQPCLEKLVKLTDEGLMPEVPGKMLWLCSVCAPKCEVMTTVYSGNGGTSAGKPSQSRRGKKALDPPQPQVDPPPPPPLPPPTTTDEPPAPERDGVVAEGVVQNSQREVETIERDIRPATVPAGTVELNDQEEALPGDAADCELYKRGECPYGMSGKTGGTCSGKHRKRCNKFLTWGDKHDKGCKEETCEFLHPVLCVKSLDMECLDEKCQAKLHTRKCKRPVKKRQERDGRREGGDRRREGNRERRATGSGPPAHRTGRAGPGGGAMGQWRNGDAGRGGGGGNRRNIPLQDIPVWANERTSGRNQDLQMAGLQKILEAQQKTMMDLFQQETTRFRGEMMMMMLNQGGAQGGAMPRGREGQGGGWYNQHYY